MRKEIVWFAEEMEHKLKANDHKGGWEEMSYIELLMRLEEETLELIKAISSGDVNEIIKEASDVSNFSMMIADKALKEGAE